MRIGVRASSGDVGGAGSGCRAGAVGCGGGAAVAGGGPAAAGCGVVGVGGGGSDGRVAGGGVGALAAGRLDRDASSIAFVNRSAAIQAERMASSVRPDRVRRATSCSRFE